MADAMFSWLRFFIYNRRHTVHPVYVERRAKPRAQPMNCKEANVALNKAINRLKRAVAGE